MTPMIGGEDTESSVIDLTHTFSTQTSILKLILAARIYCTTSKVFDIFPFSLLEGKLRVFLFGQQGAMKHRLFFFKSCIQLKHMRPPTPVGFEWRTQTSPTQ